MAEAAVADHKVTDEEYDMLVRIASALDVDSLVIEQRIRPYRAVASVVTLTPGMTVVFTGDDPYYHRDTLAMMATEMGLTVQTGVSKSTQLVAAADPASNSGKAGKARAYGIPIVATKDLLKAAIGGSVPAHGSGQAGLKVITCPDCHATWTVPATTAGPRSKRCGDCAASVGRPVARKQAVSSAWAPPNIEWLTCQKCSRRWHRQVIRGRKPILCPECISGLA